MANNPKPWRIKNGSATSSPGLVVSIPALLAAQAHINRNIAPDHQRFLACLPRDKDDEPIPEIRDFAEFTRSVLGWRDSDLEPVRPATPSTPPTRGHAPRIPRDAPPDARRPGIRAEGPESSLDDAGPGAARRHRAWTRWHATDDRHWQATPHAKFERLLRETQVPIGLLVNARTDPPGLRPARRDQRLPHVPRRRNGPGRRPADLRRPAHAALRGAALQPRREAAAPGHPRRQPQVPERRLDASWPSRCWPRSYELVRGFQAADDQAKGELLRDVLAADPNHVYHGLLTVLMRLVFILYAEDRGLLSSDPVYANYYSVTGLFERLRADAGRYPDTMDQRYGAWAQLLTLFRLIYEGGSHGDLQHPGPPRLSVRSRPLHLPRRPAAGRPARRPTRATSDDSPRLRRRDLPRPRTTCSSSTANGSATGPSTSSRSAASTKRSWASTWRSPRAARSPSSRRRPTAPRRRINLEELLAAEAGRPGQVAQGTDRPDADRPGARRPEEGRDHRRPARRPGKQDRPRGDAERRLQGRDDLPAERRTPPQRFALHAAIAHRADRPHDARSRSSSDSARPADARADPRPEGLRPGDGLRRLPGRSLPAARRRAGQGLARPRLRPAAAARRGRGPPRPPARSPSAACTAWTRTRWPSTWPSCRSGWRRWPRTIPSRSSTMPCAAAIRWSA